MEISQISKIDMFLNAIKIKKKWIPSNLGKWRYGWEGREREKEWGTLETNYSEHCLLPIILQVVLSESDGPELKTRFLPLWSKPSCPILPMPCMLETHLHDNKTALLKMFQLIFVWQWENIVCFDCNCCQTLQWSFHTYLF